MYLSQSQYHPSMYYIHQYNKPNFTYLDTYTFFHTMTPSFSLLNTNQNLILCFGQDLLLWHCNSSSYIPSKHWKYLITFSAPFFKLCFNSGKFVYIKNQHSHHKSCIEPVFRLKITTIQIGSSNTMAFFHSMTSFAIQRVWHILQNFN